MNYIIKDGRNFMSISNKIEAEYHKHWMLQMFLSSQEETSIEVNGERILCSAILVNMDTVHSFNSESEFHFTILMDPTTELGCAAKRLLMDQPYYVFPYEKTIVMQADFKKLLKQKCNDDIIFYCESIISHVSYGNIKGFDERVTKVLNLLDDCMCEDELHQLKYLSKKTYLSESRLAHLFKDQTGIPLKSYIVLHKLQKAYELIFNGENLTVAAIEAGFYSPSHFAYTNKMMTGMSATNIVKDSEFLKVL
ncbi:AraC-like DNA-binding protein [Cerasibacillus quisquiliarum]|uniref:AraC family transcriptional regulator n=2 Tax=Bacilli TaxID=91061 RepID=A0A511V2U4_9BACI|nr:MULTISPECIES: AraC family transcriptional regulator [Bacilli]MBB5147532.1 AraC-like DNA-binding protein [Cerasibacillus quisquiliarum]NLJ17264.1 helix-turn-helix domain-containing protein [Globicatella sulfidifaciens]GEN32381.1 AraC family transcriptional regulator [Cerasibacillus quisquiliarum]